MTKTIGTIRESDNDTSPITQGSVQVHHDGHLSERASDDTKLDNKSAPIKLLTDNGYTIVRRSEIDSGIKDDAHQCLFTVEDRHGKKRDICVKFDDQVIADIQRRRRNVPLSMQSKYWLVCAESQLATYLWEHNQFPPANNLRIVELTGDELLLGAHWRDHDQTAEM